MSSSGIEILNSFSEYPIYFRSVSHGNNTLEYFEKRGYLVSYIKSNLSGAPDPKDIEKAINKNTKLIVLSAANNETGIKQNIEEIGDIAKKYNIPFVIDAISYFGKETFSIPSSASAVAFSSHKIHGPKGIGMFWISNSLQIHPTITGGYQEFSKRAGTENIIGKSRRIIMATYLIRPGRSTEKDKSREDYCLNNNVTSIGWGSAGNFTNVKSYQGNQRL